MKMKYMGYKERKQEVREMTVGDMFVSLAESLIERNELQLPIRFFWYDSGEYDEFADMNAMLTSGWNTMWKIRVLRFRAMMDTDTQKDKYIYVVLESAEEDGDEL